MINPLTGQPFTTAYLNSLAYTYGTFLQQMPALRAQQDAKYPGTGDDPQILLSKQATALGALYPRDFPTTKAHHFNLGIQRELGANMAVQADVVYRKMLNGTPGGFFGTSVDYNKFNAIGGPVIPACTAASANNPAAQCSSGPINFWWPGAEAEDTGLLLRLDKRYSNRYSFTVSYALQDSQSIRDIAQNLNDYFATYGPDLPRHNLTVSGVFDVPWGIQVSVLSTYMSAPPVAPTIAGVDNTGTNTTTGATTPLLTLLGQGYADFLSNDELASLVDEYNASIAGTLTPAGAAGVLPNQRYPTIRLPESYSLGDAFSSQDIRVTKTFRIGGPDRSAPDRRGIQRLQCLEPDELQLQPVGPGDVRKSEPARRPDVRIGRPARGTGRYSRQLLTRSSGLSVFAASRAGPPSGGQRRGGPGTRS